MTVSRKYRQSGKRSPRKIGESVASQFASSFYSFLVSLIKPENMHIVSARLFLESAIPRGNALCAEIYMRSIILCELEEKPTYVVLPEDADIYLYGFAVDFVSFRVLRVSFI